MSAVSAAPGRVRERVGALPAWLVIALGLTGLVLASVALRTQGFSGKFWIDEGLSVGIADRPLGDIPGILRLDGSPPLWYMMLNLWMGVAGSGERETHALSLLFALTAIPVTWGAARLLWGPREAWIGALLAAVLPYLTYYAQETRMYSLVALLSLVVVASFALAFVQGRRAFLPVLSVALLLSIYTHNWALFLAAGTVVAFGVLLAQTPPDRRRALLRDGAIAYVPVGLLYLPWVPRLLFQAAHTGAPWAERPSPGEAVNGLNQMLGGPGPSVAVLLGAGAGWWALTAGRRRLGEGSEAARLATTVAVCGLAGLVLAWVASQGSPAWANRYFAVFVGPVLLLCAVGFARGGRIALVALALTTLFTLDPREGELRTKSNAFATASAFTARLEPGDEVLVTHPEQAPVMAYYLPDGLRWSDSLGPVADPRVFDWRDALPRLEAAEPIDVAEPLITRLAPGQRLLLVQPMIRSSRWRAPWTSLVRERAGQWERLLNGDRRLRRVDTAPKIGLAQPPRGVRGVLYVRR